MNEIIPWILAVTAGVGVGAAVWQTVQTRRTAAKISAILDAAIAGGFTEETFDESLPAKLEQKLRRFVAANTLATQNAQTQRDITARLISDISHQTKTPITNIVMYSELLKEQPDLPPTAQNLTESIVENAAKLDFLVQSLIKTARLEQGVLQMRPEPALAAELVHHALAPLLPKGEQKEIQITCRVPDEELVFADAKWTGEALYNIIDNAIKYTPRGGSIAISCRSYETFCKIDIADTGPGIPEEQHGSIFTRFWRAPAAAQEEGLGIGLFLARQIIQEQDGYIRLASQPGEGSVFSVFLPKEKRI